LLLITALLLLYSKRHPCDLNYKFDITVATIWWVKCKLHKIQSSAVQNWTTLYVCSCLVK